MAAKSRVRPRFGLLNMNKKILGYVMARNEWPILGLSVTHALLTLADEVLVLDHGSTDGTTSGLLALQVRFPGRIEVLRLDQPEYFQEATTVLVSSLVDLKNYDWVYIFDADEFLIVNKEQDLRSILFSQPLEVSAVRYQIQQWVVPYNFDDIDIDHYRRIRYRAIPVLPSEPPAEFIEQEIQAGNLNYYDAPFPSKIVFRSQHFFSAGAGAHTLRNQRDSKEAYLPEQLVVCGHLPFLGKRRLSIRSTQGKWLIDLGFPPSHGWQSQMVHRLDREGQMDQFWQNHSFHNGPLSMNDLSARPKLELSDSFSEALVPAIDLMANILENHQRYEENPMSAKLVQQPLTVAAVFPIVDRLIRERNNLSNQLENIKSIEEIEESASWRITAPLREIARIAISLWWKISNSPRWARLLRIQRFPHLRIHK